MTLVRSFIGIVLTALAVGASAQAQDSSLDAVMKAGVLRACTPGDYKPFSFQRADGAFEGLDVDLAQSLAAAMGVKLELVKTSWANLLPDFGAGKCDVAIGGISVSTERQKRVFFSTPYMVNGKTPLVRCEDVPKYQSVADIDKPGVRAIANPGGSNERFARANFKAATLTIHADNLTIFDELLARRADVFVTEAAETLVQHKLRPGLCAVNPERPLQYGEMAWMLPRDMVMKSFVDQWLHLAKAGGEYQRTADKWLR
ncbi:transporter substrate-binding domain-containing protein [Rhizobacter sp. OV335]|jgi:cyclohexadienyl dehydratase|uniref:transporter substrate-binding domain-containing protein n=1 Tax=Rhizobacter sp. OV335 TaxID=1500264 RepID=UPI0009241DB9|nr:transporter substrate-binding domain-containing protein [Rhizobacter sp. OV335]SHL91950.1 cyclohexadienyl dehydratase [Rhizobacter sp. OV335]